VNESSWIEKNMDNSPLKNKGSLKDEELKELTDNFEIIFNSDSPIKRGKSSSLNFPHIRKLNRGRLNSDDHTSMFANKLHLVREEESPNSAEDQEEPIPRYRSKNDIHRLLKEVVKNRRLSELEERGSLENGQKTENKVHFQHQQL
jgi:hypothetical protein